VYKPPSDDRHVGEKPGRTSPAHPRYKGVSREPAQEPQEPFYADEHPEIPRIRRASLKQTRIERTPYRVPNLEEEPPRGEMAPRERQNSRRKPAEMPPFTGLETYDEIAPFPPEQEEGARNKRSSGRAYPRTRKMSPVTSRPPLQHIRHRGAPFWGRKRSWLFIGLLALFVLVLAPILVGIVRNMTTQQSTSSKSTRATISIARLQSVPSNTHELVIVPPETNHPAPPVLATSAYLLDTDSEATLYAQNPFLHLPMLSTTKLMTAAIAVQTGNLDQEITITPAMEHDISQLSADSALFGVKQGETYTLRDLLYGLLYVSGNDAALVIADALAGSVPKFVAEMNQKAQELGLRDTHFVNPHGLLDPGQYSCARDLAVLGQYALSIPVIQQISSGRTYHIAAGGKHGARVLLNENQFLWWYPGVTGGKTGYDGASDFVQVMAVTRNHRHLVGVVMHTDNWWTDMRDLIDYGSVDYAWESPRDVEDSGQPIPYDNLWNYFTSDTQDVTVPTVDHGSYYIYSGYSVSGPMLSYFNKQGGLKKFGFPMAMPVPSGSMSMSQQFQHGSILCNLSTNQCSTI
jgi:D-alanyl-D-alanine carboxypeptidase